VRLASKYPRIARQMLESKPWGAEVFKLSGSVELAPLLHLAEVALDIVQTGRTLEENGLVELEVVHEVAPCLVVNRSAFQLHRKEINRWLAAFEAAGVAE
jgi:ATP phosphoribosyltransferase